MYTWAQIKSRGASLTGESSASTELQAQLNSAVQDIVNSYNFSWNLATDTLTLTAGKDDLAADYNPRWHIHDARIVSSGTGNDNIFTEIELADRDKYSSDDYVYWIVYDATNKIYTFNTLTQTGTVIVYYNFSPADMTADADQCVVPDGEAVAYLGAAKNWLADERDEALKADFEEEAAGRIRAMYQHDLMFGANIGINSKILGNPELRDQ